jgi:hypothetical protein
MDRGFINPAPTGVSTVVPTGTTTPMGVVPVGAVPMYMNINEYRY